MLYNSKTEKVVQSLCIFFLNKTLEVNHINYLSRKLKYVTCFISKGNSSTFSNVLSNLRHINNILCANLFVLLIFLRKGVFLEDISVNLDFGVSLILFTLDFTHGIQVFSRSNSYHT